MFTTWNIRSSALVVILGFSVLVSTTLAQSDSSPPTVRKAVIDSDRSKWISVDLGDLSVSVPPGITVEEAGRHGFYSFRGFPEGIRLTAIVEPPTPRPAYKFPEWKGYKEEFVKIEGRRIWFWSYEQAPTEYLPYRYFYGVNTDYPRPPKPSWGATSEWSILVQLWSTNDQSTLANSILRSIKFTPEAPVPDQK